jgi:hypothetical protein
MAAHKTAGIPLLGICSTQLVGEWMGREARRKVYYDYNKVLGVSPLINLYYLYKYGMNLTDYNKLMSNLFKRKERRADKIIIATKNGPKALSTFPISLRRTVIAKFAKRNKKGQFSK